MKTERSKHINVFVTCLLVYLDLGPSFAMHTHSESENFSVINTRQNIYGGGLTRHCIVWQLDTSVSEEGVAPIFMVGYVPQLFPSTNLHGATTSEAFSVTFIATQRSSILSLMNVHLYAVYSKFYYVCDWGPCPWLSLVQMHFG